MARRLDDDVPRLPRGRGMRISGRQLVQLVMVAVALVAVITLQRPCATSVSKFVTSFDDTDAAPVRRIDAGAPATPDGVMLRGDMTPEELQAAIAKARAAAQLDAGVGAIDAGPTVDAGAR